MQHGAIILCGGGALRMGQEKVWLPFGPGETMLQRVVRLVGQVVRPEHIVCVAAAGQKLPELPPGVQVAHDRRPGLGPLEGLAVGLATLQDQAEAIFATSCDVPLLLPALVEQMFDRLENFDLVVPQEGKHYHPLAAIYRTNLLPLVEQMLATDQRRLDSLLSHGRVRTVPVEELRTVDLHLLSLINCNTRDEYQAALRKAGL